MIKLEQVLIIEPQNELRFRGPFDVPVACYMKLTNPSEKKVMFRTQEVLLTTQLRHMSVMAPFKLLYVVHPFIKQNEIQEESVKASPKALVPKNVETELQKVAAEVQQLREEESSLRQENLRLKEDILKFKHGFQQPLTNKYSLTIVQRSNMSMMYLTFNAALTLFGLILGKFIL